jgi:hypothetical protein
VQESRHRLVIRSDEIFPDIHIVAGHVLDVLYPFPSFELGAVFVADLDNNKE